MDEKLSELITCLESLRDRIDSENINQNGFQRHGWNQVHLKKADIVYFIENFIRKVKVYGDANITEGLISTIDGHIKNITLLNETTNTYFKDQAQYLLHIVPGILLTLNTIFYDIEFELFSYENIQDKKLLPRALSTRLRSTQTRLDSIDESSSSLEEKIAIIDEAHEAAESLPTDLASLKDAKRQLEKLIKSASTEFSEEKTELVKIKSEAQKELVQIKSDATQILISIKEASREADHLKTKTASSADTASKLAQECDDALQITTTQGLSAGFDQKAKELKTSIWIWIIGLLLALISGAWIGAERVTAFTEILSTQLTAGQAILHTIMSIFSIGGPLWLAWISTQQINQRFKLSEDYSYKATVTKSFTGFKKLAERFDSSTEERLFNSTLDRLDEMPLRLIKGKDYNSPWHEFTDSESFRTALRTIPELAREAGRFASKADLKIKPKQPKTNPSHKVKTKVDTVHPETEEA